MTPEEKRLELISKIQELKDNLVEVENTLKQKNAPGLDELKVKIVALAEKYNTKAKELDFDIGVGIMESYGEGPNVVYLVKKEGQNYKFP